MSDRYLLPLAQAASAAYTAVPWFATKTCQVSRSVVLEYPTYAFRGTDTALEWLVDFMAPDVPFYQHPIVGPIHLGFYLDIRTAVAAIAADLAALGWPSFLLCGHSKGAGEAELAELDMKLLGHPPLAVRAYEPPCVGTAALAKFLADGDHGWTKTVNASGADIVTQVPDWPEWCHYGVETQLRVPDSDGIAAKHEIPAVLAALAAL